MRHCRISAVLFILLACGATTGAQDRTVDLLRLLADTPGAPGFEEPIRKVMVDAMRPFASSITFDGLGSIIATQGTSGPRIMVDA
ncbi:MAG: M42 family peptidase, partial [Acidobacteriota bacterium]|nr:M42 family peptidase [Acidobacteriota bacterium]